MTITTIDELGIDGIEELVELIGQDEIYVTLRTHSIDGEVAIINGINYATMAGLVVEMTEMLGYIPADISNSTAFVRPLIQLAAGIEIEQDSWSNIVTFRGPVEVNAFIQVLRNRG
jgi:hypothetical protein